MYILNVILLYPSIHVYFSPLNLINLLYDLMKLKKEKAGGLLKFYIVEQVRLAI